MIRTAVKIPRLRAVTHGKADFRGLKIMVVESTDNAYLLRLYHTRLNITMFQVIDNDRTGLYPIKNIELEALDVFRTNNLDEAKVEFQKRK